MVGPMILLLCTNIATSHKDTRLACQKAFEAGVVHTGHDKKIKNYAKTKEREYKEIIGENAALSLIAIHTIFIKQEISASLYRFAGTQSTVVRFSSTQAAVTLNWRF